ncbi:MAG: glycosyltransferase WbuB, partial [Thauera sp.]|nr:glycosyltransferase WbuB [Thauera sp.]
FKAGSAEALAAAIDDMLDHRERWPVMREAGRHFVEVVRNWQNSVANYTTVYDRLTQRKAK